jgi:DNA-binding transcriptional LysR family regulator
MFAWDDIAVFLALYRERTTGRAATVLGVSQPTVVRRIAALEQSLGFAMFDRTPAGLVATPAADSLYASAGRIERGVIEFAAESDALRGREADLIRLTLLDHFEPLLVPLLRQFRERHPSVRTELLSSDQIYDLARGEADIAIRGRNPAATDELVVRDMPPCGFAIYASAYNCPEERPSGPGDVKRFPLAFLDGPPGELPIYRWLRNQATGPEDAIVCSNFRSLSSAIAAGAVISALPCTMGDSDRRLVRCFEPEEEFDVPVYLVARRVILRRRPARDLFDSIGAYFLARPALLTGVRN